MSLTPQAVPQLYENHYTCPECGHEWSDKWDCQPDDDCPECGHRHVSPHDSDDVPFTDIEAAEIGDIEGTDLTRFEIYGNEGFFGYADLRDVVGHQLEHRWNQYAALVKSLKEVTGQFEAVAYKHCAADMLGPNAEYYAAIKRAKDLVHSCEDFSGEFH